MPKGETEVVWAQLGKVRTPLFLPHFSKGQSYFFKDFPEEM